jgi:hypothetical protein
MWGNKKTWEILGWDYEELQALRFLSSEEYKENNKKALYTHRRYIRAWGPEPAQNCEPLLTGTRSFI